MSDSEDKQELAENREETLEDSSKEPGPEGSQDLESRKQKKEREALGPQEDTPLPPAPEPVKDESRLRKEKEALRTKPRGVTLEDER